MICVNVNSPFNYCCQWLKSPAQKAIQDDDSWGCQAHVPRWVRPGFHNLDVATVLAGKTDIGPAGIGEALSLYFAKHKSVVQGLIRMHSLFQWQVAGSSDSDIDLCPQCHTPNMFGTVDIEIISSAFRKLKGFFKNIFIGLKHLKLRKRKIVDVIPHAGYYELKKDSDANDMTVQQYYCETYNIHIK